MKKRIIQSLSLSLILFALVSFENTANWAKSSNSSNQYKMGANIPENKEGIGVVTIKSSAAATNTDFGGLIHQLNAQTFAGKRVRISGLIKIENASQGGGFWLKANQSLTDHNVTLQSSHRVKHIGTTGNYKFTTLVVDIPVQSSGIAYGAYLQGGGQLYAARVQFDIVDNTVPLTN